MYLGAILTPKFFAVGDLDPNISPYTLTPLKVVYKKLRLLVDRGCVFIGHGLSKDFRIISMLPTDSPVIPSVDVIFAFNLRYIRPTGTSYRHSRFVLPQFSTTTSFAPLSILVCFGRADPTGYT